jgi:hypothetical protein
MQFLSLVDRARRADAASVDRIFQHSDFAPAINHFSSPRQNNFQFFFPARFAARDHRSP